MRTEKQKGDRGSFVHPNALWDRFQTLTSAEIVAMNGTEQEGRLLDFKRFDRDDFGKDEKRNLAKAVCGFVNTSGGLFVGVQCQ